ncbi:MAG: hypothetical protein MSJ26_04790 [Oscillospiraceae bacterium]|nr:hypothetical protein [Oscillospiraceae bacterium]
MKKNPIFVICLTLLLTACRNEKKEPEETDMIETTAAAETSAVVSEIKYESDSEPLPETEITKPLLIDEREPVPEGLTEALDLKEFEDEGYHLGSYAVSGGDILLVYFTYDPNRGDVKKPPYLLGIALTEKNQLFRIDAPSSDCYFTLFETITDGERTACAELSRIGGEKISLIELDKDGNYKITEGMDHNEIVYSWGERAVKNTNGNIENVLDGSLLCERTGEETEEDSVKSKIYRFDMPIDENRFAFMKFGYEWVESVGIYDFETDDITILPDSMDTSFLGIHNGTIYTVDSVDGVGENVYCYDPETLERKHFCGSPYEIGMNDMIYEMPESGEFIAALYSPCYEREEAARLALLSPETGEIMAEYTLSDKFISYYPPFITDNYVCIFESDSDIIYTLPMPKGKFFIEDKGDVTELCYTYLGNTQTVKSYDNTVTWNPDIFTVREFKNVLGSDGVCLSEKYENRNWSSTYYYADMKGSFLNIAESFGNDGGKDDAIIDLDNDGINELITNCVYGGDGAQVCYIYKMTDEGVMRASGHDLIDSKIMEMQTRANAVFSKYLPEKNKMLCGYYDENGEYVRTELDIETDKLEFDIFNADE